MAWFTAMCVCSCTWRANCSPSSRPHKPRSPWEPIPAGGAQSESGLSPEALSLPHKRPSRPRAKFSAESPACLASSLGLGIWRARTRVACAKDTSWSPAQPHGARALHTHLPCGASLSSAAPPQRRHKMTLSKCTRGLKGFCLPGGHFSLTGVPEQHENPAGSALAGNS